MSADSSDTVRASSALQFRACRQVPSVCTRDCTMVFLSRAVKWTVPGVFKPCSEVHEPL